MGRRAPKPYNPSASYFRSVETADRIAAEALEEDLDDPEYLDDLADWDTYSTELTDEVL